MRVDIDLDSWESLLCSVEICLGRGNEVLTGYLARGLRVVCRTAHDWLCSTVCECVLIEV